MNTTALILVDIQPTFCEGGDLPVDGGNQVAADAAAYLRTNRNDYAFVATTQDWHIDPGTHFADNPDFVDTWPAHGVAGTPNANLHPDLAKALSETTGARVTIRKGQYEAAYSAFDGTDDNKDTLLAVLRQRGITRIDVAGIAESHCVRATVLDGLEAGLEVRLLTDLVAGVTPEAAAQARQAMLNAGATAHLTARN